MKTKKLPRKLPKFLKKYFWEIKLDEINPDKADFYIINRLLDRGNLKAVKWVFQNFSQSLIRETIKTRRDWQKQSIYFWINYFKLKPSEVKCLQKPYLEQRNSCWPY